MIYFDNAATTQPFNTPGIFYNPSSPHSKGIEAEKALVAAREKIAVALGPSSNQGEVIFTSGGTESNNMAIIGYALSQLRNPIFLVANPYEHPSVLVPMHFSCEQSWASGFYPDIKERYMGPSLIALSHVNHETGDINDVNAVAAKIKKNNPNAVILVDGVQAFCKENINLDGIDFYSFSGHKCHGPTGAGGLWIRKGMRIVPSLYGGGQENGLRSGTENVAGIVQMADAVHMIHDNIAANKVHAANVKEVFLGLKDMLPRVSVNSLGGEASPYILNMSFLGVKGEILVHALSEKGIYVSMGAACRSRKKARPALEIMGFSSEIAESAIRFSFSHLNTVEEAETVRDIIIDEVTRFRKILGGRF